MKLKLHINALLSVAIVFTQTAFAQEPVWDANKVVLTSEKLDTRVRQERLKYV